MAKSEVLIEMPEFEKQYNLAMVEAEKISSRVRPKQMILTVTPIIETARKLTLVWGVKCIVQKDANNLEEMIKMTKKYSKKEKIIKVGEKMVVTAGLPLKKLGTTNLIRVIKID